jgi:hypothetical protein
MKGKGRKKIRVKIIAIFAICIIGFFTIGFFTGGLLAEEKQKLAKVL